MGEDLSVNVPIKVAVTGTGRCGTVTFAHLLNHMGISCGHEAYFGQKLAKGDVAIDRVFESNPLSSRVSKKAFKLMHPEWLDKSKYQAESSYLMAPFLEHKMFDNIKIIHLYRDPIKVIDSFVYKFNYFKEMGRDWYEVFMRMHLPYLKQPNTPINRAAYYWYSWNKMILDSSRVALRVNIEDVDLKKICEFLQVEYNDISIPQSNSKSDGFRRCGWVDIDPELEVKIKQLWNTLETKVPFL